MPRTSITPAAAAILAGLALVLQAAGCAADSSKQAGAPPDNTAVSAPNQPAPAETPPQPAIPATTTAPAARPDTSLDTPVRPQQSGNAGDAAPPAGSAKAAPATPALVKPASPPVGANRSGKPPAAATARNEAQALPPLALATLEQRLRDTSAIGVFTKLALKNQVDDILAQVRAHHEGRGPSTLNQLRQGYDQLLQKVHDLLKNGDPPLATAIMNSREAIWAVLTDPVKFAKL